MSTKKGVRVPIGVPAFGVGFRGVVGGGFLGEHKGKRGGVGEGGDRQRNRQVIAHVLSKLPFGELPLVSPQFMAKNCITRRSACDWKCYTTVIVGDLQKGLAEGGFPDEIVLICSEQNKSEQIGVLKKTRNANRNKAEENGTFGTNRNKSG